MLFQHEKQRTGGGFWRYSAATVVTCLALTGCGGGGGGGTPSYPQGATVGQSTTQNAINSYRLTGDGYGLQNGTFLTATEMGATVVLRSAIATSSTDPNFSTVFRIDIDQPSAITGPGTYSLDGTASPQPAFPGAIYFFDGHASTLLSTVGGTITFTSYGTAAGATVAGSFQALVQDGYSATTPKPTYTISADFSYVLGTANAVTPAVSPVPANGVSLYDTRCAGCHQLGTYDTSSGSGPDLARDGGAMNGTFTAGTPGHQNITLTADDIYDLKVFLNAN